MVFFRDTPPATPSPQTFDCRLREIFSPVCFEFAYDMATRVSRQKKKACMSEDRLFGFIGFGNEHDDLDRQA